MSLMVARSSLAIIVISAGFSASSYWSWSLRYMFRYRSWASLRSRSMSSVLGFVVVTML